MATNGHRSHRLAIGRIRFAVCLAATVLTALAVAESPPTATNPSQVASELAIQRADGHIRRGLDLAERQATYSAQDEFVQALRLIAADRDLATGGAHEHAAALETGLRALNSMTITAHMVIAANRSDFAEQRRQLGYVQERLAFSVRPLPIASMALYLLGRSQTAIAGETPEEAAFAAPKAIALYQAALSVDPANYLAANELGVLLASYGQLEDARQVLSHGVSVAPQPATWRNLAVVCKRMGDNAAAQHAQSQCDALAAARRAHGQNVASSPSQAAAASVRWVNPAEFVQCSGSDLNAPSVQRDAPAARQPAAPATTASRSGGVLPIPDWISSGLKNLGGKGDTSQNR
jgi:tetratricopeptide (TPR) repeat protein